MCRLPRTRLIPSTSDSGPAVDDGFCDLPPSIQAEICGGGIADVLDKVAVDSEKLVLSWLDEAG